MPREFRRFLHPTLKVAADQASIATGISIECQLTMAEIQVENATTEIPKTPCADPADVPNGSKWKLHLEWLQDMGATDSLSDFAYDNNQEQVYFEMVLDTTATPQVKYAGDAFCSAGNVGGAWDGSAATASADWNCVSQPTRTTTP